MSPILIVSATPFEIEPTLRELKVLGSDSPSFIRSYSFKNKTIDVVVTGAGMVNTAFYLGQLTGKKYDQVINAGICGSFRAEIKIGDVVNIAEDCFADLGAQDDDRFLSISEIDLGNEKVRCEHPVREGKLASLQVRKGITVNTVHGNTGAIEKTVKRLDPDVESMEGAAFLMACNYYKWPCAQVRAVSNKVEKRDRESWNIPLAIKQLNDFLIAHLNTL